jgi:2-iminobutanoate/2-iminopropanoate deaminase
MDFLFTDRAPTPSGHYSQGVFIGPFLFISGQLPIVAGEPLDPEADVRKQTVRTIRNIEAIVVAGGMTLSDIVKTTVFVESMELWHEVNEAYAECFGNHRPARSVVPCGTLHHGFKVEIEAYAIRPS